MDGFQIFLAIFIPLIVSVLAWTLTYIIPYTSPNWLSNRVLTFTKNQPTDPIEIGIIINQFSKYDDWKRLTANKRMKQMFIQKIREIDKKYETKHNLQFTSKEVKEHFTKQLNELEEAKAKYLQILEEHPNTILWDEWTSFSDTLEIYDKEGYSLTSKELEFLLYPEYATVDKDKKMTTERFLERTGHKYPKKRNDKEIITEFNELILYIDYPHTQSKKDELIYRLALGLSNHEKSLETLNELINEVKGQIFSKDYKKWEKNLRIF